MYHFLLKQFEFVIKWHFNGCPGCRDTNEVSKAINPIYFCSHSVTHLISNNMMILMQSVTTPFSVKMLIIYQIDIDRIGRLKLIYTCMTEWLLCFNLYIYVYFRSLESQSSIGNHGRPILHLPVSRNYYITPKLECLSVK